MANVELDPELDRLKVARTTELAKETAATSLGATTPTGAPTSVQAALDALKTTLDEANEAQLQALADLNTSIGQSNTAINQAISAIQQQLDAGGGGAAIKSYVNSSTLAAGGAVTLPVGTTAKPILLYKIATGLTQLTAKNVDVTLAVGGFVVYRAESLAQSVDSTFPVFTDHTGDITLTLENKSADSCDVATTVKWSEL